MKHHTTSKTKSLEELTDEIIATKVELKNRIETLLSLARKEVIKEMIETLKLEKWEHIKEEYFYDKAFTSGYNEALEDLEYITKKFLEKENI